VTITTRRIGIALALAGTVVRSAVAQRGNRGGGPAEPPLTATSTDPLAALRFRSIGPALTSGRLADMAIDPRNPHLWYVATAGGGLWKTTNSGLTFTSVFDNYGSYSTCCVLIDPKNSNTIWLATGENTNHRSAMAGDGIYKSTDAGATWKRVGLALSEKIGRMAIDPRNSDVVYVAAQGPLWAAGGERGLYKTADGGATWKAVLQISENTGITDVVLDPRNPDVLYAASYQRRRNPGLLIGGGPESAIYKSENAGANWRKLTNGLPTVDIGRIGLAISPQNPDVLYATIAAQGDASGFFRSADKGETWVKQSNWVSGDPQYYGEITPDPARFDHLCGVAVTPACTRDGGKTFQPVTWGVHSDHHYIAFDPSDTLHMWDGNDGGLYETMDAGRTWHHFENLPILQFYRIAVDNAVPFYNVYGGTQDNGSPGTPTRSPSAMGIRSSDVLSVNGGDGFYARIDPVDPAIIYASSQNAAFVRLDKRTGTSTSIAPPRFGPDSVRTRLAFEVPLIISPHKRERLYVFTNVLYKSEDRGDHWTPVSKDLTRSLNRDTFTVMGRKWGANAVNKHLFTNDLSLGTALDESPVTPGLIYAGTDDGLIQVTENGGTTWRTISEVAGVPAYTPVSSLVASRYNANVVYAAFNNQLHGDFTPYVFKSTDRGRTWTSIRANLPNRNEVWTIVEDHVNQNLLFIGTEHGAYVTLNGGAGWQQLKAGLPTVAVRDIQIQRGENDLLLGTFGRGIYVLDDYTPLRALAGPAPGNPDAVLLSPRRAWLYVPTPFERGGAGNGLYVGENTFGALLSYTLRDPTPAGSDVVLTVKDAANKDVALLAGPAGVGLNRAIWNLRTFAPPSANGRGRGGAGRGGAGDSTATDSAAAPARATPATPPLTGPLVPAGRYTIQLNRRTNGALTPLGAAQRLDVVPVEARR
jgi:photosystem II stability/assembly factor-like uncharacterized protein